MTINPAKYTPNLTDTDDKHPLCVVCYASGVTTWLPEPIADMDDALCADHADTVFEDV